MCVYTHTPTASYMCMWEYECILYIRLIKCIMSLFWYWWMTEVKYIFVPRSSRQSKLFKLRKCISNSERPCFYRCSQQLSLSHWSHRWSTTTTTTPTSTPTKNDRWQNGSAISWGILDIVCKLFLKKDMIPKRMEAVRHIVCVCMCVPQRKQSKVFFLVFIFNIPLLPL